MEKIFHKEQLAKLASMAPALDGEQVRMNREHLWLSQEVATHAFGDERQVYMTYDPEKSLLLLAPMSDLAFKKQHECSLVMLKDRNLQGDKSLSLQEVIIDHDLDSTDRPLAFSSQAGIRLLQVNLAT